jgi:uncharacterized protein (DUF1800 family)
MSVALRNAGIVAALLVGMLVACGGGSSSSSSTGSPTTLVNPAESTTPQAAVSMSLTDAARLLEQATFGPTPSEVKRVAALGFDAYMAEQIAEPTTGYSGFTYVPQLATVSCEPNLEAPAGTASLCARDNYTVFQVQRQFFQNALTGPDQLRQRVAFALSQIFVVSGEKLRWDYAMAAYQNLLLNDAFSNYRKLIEDVTLSPAMGWYLDMAKNAKSNPIRGTSPNQNYAREILQLFSIGVNKLNPDGSLALDANHQPQATYNQNVIEGFSAVFTGWTFAPLPSAAITWNNPVNFQGPLVSFPEQHDSGTKLLLDGAIAPAGQSPEADLILALDVVFNHPNVGPFIGKQLIQHLVTSNPSPAYVARVASVFANNGQGVRGDLAAVVKAILGDVEARGDAPSQPSAGHLREPALFITTVMRGLGARSDGILLRSSIAAMGQPIFWAPTVFNFYPPSYEIPGSGKVAPEFFIQDAATGLARSNFVNQLLFHSGAPADPTVKGSFGTMVDLSQFVRGNPTPAEIVAELSATLMHGSLSKAAQDIIVSALSGIPDALGQAQTAAYLITSSEQFQVER